MTSISKHSMGTFLFGGVPCDMLLWLLPHCVEDTEVRGHGLNAKAWLCIVMECLIPTLLFPMSGCIAHLLYISYTSTCMYMENLFADHCERYSFPSCMALTLSFTLKRVAIHV